MATPLDLRTDRGSDGASVLRAVGELDLSNVERFAAAIAENRSSADSRLVVDLSAVEDPDSGAISVLFDNTDHIEVVVNRNLMAVLKISGFSDVAAVRLASA
jgi:anti-anti-sigma regulatory factor